MLNLPAVSATEPVTAIDLARAGLLEAGSGCRISPHAVFAPADELGTREPGQDDRLRHRGPRWAC